MVTGYVVETLLVAAGAALLHEQVAFLRPLAITELVVLRQVLILWHQLHFLFNTVNEVHEARPEALLFDSLVKLTSLLTVLFYA